MQRQEYAEKPLTEKDVRGASSKTIFKFMTMPADTFTGGSHPVDVDDFERNRALFLCYPEWKERLHEMAVLGTAWARLTANWARIEELYAKDELACNDFIRSLVH